MGRTDADAEVELDVFSTSVQSRIDAIDPQPELAQDFQKSNEDVHIQVDSSHVPDSDVLAFVEQSRPVNESALAPIDGGFGAWSFLAAAFWFESLVWGFPTAYGVILVKYMEDPALSSAPHASYLLPLIGPLASGIMYCAGPITYPLAARMPRIRRPSMYFGIVVMFVSLFGASYTKSVPLLVALQGVLYALGGAVCYAPAIYYMSEWFVKRRGLANGIMDAGTATGGLVFPLVLPPLLDKLGVAKTLRFLAIFNIGVCTLCLPFLRSRLPERRSVHGPAARATDHRLWLKNRAFWVVNAANTLQGFAYFVPLLWLPQYASSLHLSTRDASLSLALLNGAGVIGRLSLGTLSDRFSPWFLGFATLLIASFSIFVLWGVLSYTFAGLLVYSIAYGCIAGGWTSLWTGFVRPIAKDDPTLSTSMFGVLMLFRGLGSILSTPISTALQPIEADPAFTPGQIGIKVADGRYEKVIIYAGTCFAAAALMVAAGWLVDGRKWARHY